MRYLAQLRQGPWRNQSRRLWPCAY